MEPMSARAQWSVYTPRHIGNWLFATRYVQSDVRPDYVLNLLANSPVHTIVCILPDGEVSAVAERLEDCARGAEGTEDWDDAHSVLFVHRNVFVVTLKRIVSEVSVQQAVVVDGRAFAIVQCRVQLSNTAVAVGIVAAFAKVTRLHIGDNSLPPRLVSIVHDSVYKKRCSFVDGNLGRHEGANVRVVPKLAIGH